MQHSNDWLLFNVVSVVRCSLFVYDRYLSGGLVVVYATFRSPVITTSKLTRARFGFHAYARNAQRTITTGSTAPCIAQAIILRCVCKGGNQAYVHLSLIQFSTK